MVDVQGQMTGVKTIQTAQPTQTSFVYKTGVNTTILETILSLERRFSSQQEDLLLAHKKEDDIKMLIQALPTCADIEALIGKVEEAHCKELQGIHGEIQTISERLIVDEDKTHSLEQRINALEKDKTSQAETAKAFKLQLEELEDHRNKVRLRGSPESIDQENLDDKVRGILLLILGESAPANMELYRIHRALGPKSTDSNHPRDVICRLHYFSQKESILKETWETGIVELEGARIKILPDLSKATLQPRALLRPVLNRIRQLGYTYCWRLPFAVTVRNNSSSFTLSLQTNLPGLFNFLEIEPFPVPDWRQILPPKGGCKEVAPKQD